MTAAAALEAAGVRIGGARLLDAVSVTAAPGTVTAILGPNGAGKSTALRLLAGERMPTSGRALLQGRPLASYAAGELALRRAVVSQHVQLGFAFSVAEVVAMGGAGARSGGAALAAQVAAAMDETGIATLAGRDVQSLSGGEQQRVQMARALVQLACGEAVRGPGLLLLDEPTASLDLRHQLDVLAAARRRARGGTAVVAVLHDLNLAARFADRIVVLAAGRLAAAGPPATVLTPALLAEVFGVTTQVGVTAQGLPYVLPQLMA
jgi:iron complex transport system ATP-binding protein